MFLAARLLSESYVSGQCGGRPGRSRETLRGGFANHANADTALSRRFPSPTIGPIATDVSYFL
jgi:hypothetical protein